MQARDTGEQSGAARRGRWLWLTLAVLALLLAVGTAGLRWFWTRPSEVRTQIADVSSERLLALGSVVGFAAPFETHAWLGIPYAKPPVREMRWRAPESPTAWADTLDALSPGPPCVQRSSRLGGVPSDDPEGFAGDEDCLYLNVWAPRREADELAEHPPQWPVMVWIHGGGNVRGHSGSALYDGARLAGTQQMVVVSFNYRLGPFGWFSHAALRAASRTALEASGNFGSLDQILALRWVRAHIEEFGGDPDNVTIFGESAGATNVFALMLAPPAQGLFHRAIAQSGSTDSVPQSQAEYAARAGLPGHPFASSETVAALLERAGVVPDRAAARRYATELAQEDLLEFLRSRTAREILDVYSVPAADGGLETRVPTLIRDGALLPEIDWISAMRAGRFARVPVLLGTNRDEQKLFLAQDPEHVRTRFGVFHRIRDREDYARRARYHSDLWAVRGVTAPASAMAASGHNEVYAYRFDWDAWPRRFGVDFAELLGAAHGFEIPFVFGNFDLGDRLLDRLLFDEESAAERDRLFAQMSGYWAEFARHGRPGRGAQAAGSDAAPEWLSWRVPGESTARLLVLDSPDDGGIRLSRSVISRELVIAGIDAEPGLEQAEKCALFRDLFERRPDWSLDEFRRIGRRGCAAFARDPADREP